MSTDGLINEQSSDFCYQSWLDYALVSGHVKEMIVDFRTREDGERISDHWHIVCPLLLVLTKET